MPVSALAVGLCLVNACACWVVVCECVVKLSKCLKVRE